MLRIGLVLLAVVAGGVLRADEVPKAVVYKLGPDSMEQPGVPRGKVTKHQLEK